MLIRRKKQILTLPREEVEREMIEMKRIGRIAISKQIETIFKIMFYGTIAILCSEILHIINGILV
jgi:hypothetical protein